MGKAAKKANREFRKTVARMMEYYIRNREGTIKFFADTDEEAIEYATKEYPHYTDLYQKVDSRKYRLVKSPWQETMNEICEKFAKDPEDKEKAKEEIKQEENTNE